MSALGFEIYTLDLPNPEWAAGTDRQINSVNTSISYYFESTGITTLSATDGTGATPIDGLLYVPDLNPGDPCIEESAPYIPHNVTRQAELPKVEYYLVALAPWLSPQCTQNYFAAARLDPIRAFIFFQPTNTTEPPPDPTSSAWDLGDGGAWKQQNAYPVYAISGLDGVRLLLESAQYSGNLTSAPYASQLSQIYDPRDYIRLYATVAIASASFPSLWVFLLVVLGILLAIIALTSVVMHMIQRRRRESLRRRVINGEVDLEALGIKRVLVPQEELEKLPLYTYGSSPAPSAHEGSQTHETGPQTEDGTVVSSTPSKPAPAVTARHSRYNPTPLSQPTCAICLEDFVLADGSGRGGSTVRELPCHHIFHSDCVDGFLRECSSLCPMCKDSVLPKGYCPRVITNAMVRRERVLRRIRERVDEPRADDVGSDADADEYVEVPDPHPLSFQQRLRSRTFSSLSQFRGARSATNSQRMTDLSRSRGEVYVVGAPPTEAPSNISGRREWARQRALAMLGPRRAPLDPDAEDAARTPMWRKAMRGVFPAFVR